MRKRRWWFAGLALALLAAWACLVWFNGCTTMPESWRSETLPQRIVVGDRAFWIRLPSDFSRSSEGTFLALAPTKYGIGSSLWLLTDDNQTRKCTLTRLARYCAKGNVIHVSHVERWDDSPEIKGEEWVVEVHDAKAGSVRFMMHWYEPADEMIYRRALYALSIPFKDEGIVR